MQEKALSYIRRHQLLRPGDRVGVAVSAGADSVALLRLLLEARAELGIILSVVHFNHQIRGAEAEADQAFVVALARAHDLPFHSSSADTPAYARQHRVSLEAAGRALRYKYFRQLLLDGVLDRIATAHTRDDQAETVLLRLLRGAGTRGLAGIYPELSVAGSRFPESQQPSAISRQRDRPKLAIVRPLLDVSRDEVRDYVAGIGQAWREDVSNREMKFARNRIRHGLLPVLRRDFNPRIDQVLAETAEIARGEEHYWEQVVGDLQSSVVSRRSSAKPEHKLIVLHSQLLLRQPLAVQRRLLRAAAESLGCRLEFRHVEQVLDLLHRQPATAARGSPGERKSLELPGGVRAELRARELCFETGCPSKVAPQAAVGYEYQLDVPGEVRIQPLGRTIRAALVPGVSGKSGYNRAQLMDPGLLALPLRVRNWRPGDRYWPAHTKSPAKVKELLQARHIAQPEKSLWPVVLSGAEIVWVPGFPVPARYQAQDGQGPALVLEEVAVGNPRHRP